MAVALAALLLLAAVWTVVNREDLGRWWYARQPLDELVERGRARDADEVLLSVAGARLLEVSRGFEAVRLLEPRIARGGASGEVQTLWARALAASGRIPEASRAFDASLAAEPGNAETRRRAGEFLLDGERYEDAEGLLRQSLELDPDLDGARLALARLELAREHPEAAMAYLEDARDPGAPTSWPGSLYRAQALLALGRMAEAEEAARQAYAARPGVESVLALVRALHADATRERLVEARSILDRSLVKGVEDVAMLRLAALNDRLLGDHAGAVRRLRGLLRFAPVMPEAYHLLAQSYARLGRAELAEACRRAYRYLEPREAAVNRLRYRLRVEQGSPAVRVELAAAYLDLGRHDLALSMLGRVPPGTPGAAKLRRRAQQPLPELPVRLPADPEFGP